MLDPEFPCECTVDSALSLQFVYCALRCCCSYFLVFESPSLFVYLAEPLFEVFSAIRHSYWAVHSIIGLEIVQKHIMAFPDAGLALEATWGHSLPGDLIAEVPCPEHRVQHNLQIMAHGRVAVEVERAGGFEDAVELQQAGRHHYEVGHRVILADEG